MKIKDISTFERLNNLIINVFELSVDDKTLSLKYVSKNYYDEQIELLLYENHYCLITSLHNFFRNYEQNKHLCRRCFNTYGDQTKLEEHMLRCIEKKFCNISYMHPSHRIKFKDWYMKIDPPMQMAACFESTNVLITDDDKVNVNNNDYVTDKLFVSKPVAIGYNIVKSPDYENLKLEKRWLYQKLW